MPVRKGKAPTLRPKRRNAGETPQMMERLALVARMYRQGYTTKEIGDEVGVSASQISAYLKKIRKIYSEEIVSDYHAFVVDQVEHYREIRREAWEAWRVSKEPTFKEVVDFYADDPDEDEGGEASNPPQPTRAGSRRVTKQGRIPESAYLKIIMDSLEGERVLRGFQKPPDNYQQTNQTVNLTVLYGRDTEAVNPVEEMIKKQAALNPARGVKVKRSDEGPTQDAEFVPVTPDPSDHDQDE